MSKKEKNKMAPRDKLIFSLCLVLTLVWCLGRILGDGQWIIALLFYFPSPVLCLLLVISALYLFARQQRLLTSLVLVMLAFPLASIIFFENSWRATRTHAKDIKLIHWNIYSGKAGLSAIMDILKKADADIYAITEPPKELHKFKRGFSKAYEFESTQHLLLAVKGKIQKSTWLYNKNGFRIWYFKIRVAGKNMTLFLVDLASRLNLARDPFLRKLVTYIEKYQPQLVVGDLNAPRMSRALQALPEGYEHAYFQAGSGWSYTWPVPLPVLAIDHIILSKQIKGASYRLQSHWASDHRLQILEFQQ